MTTQLGRHPRGTTRSGQGDRDAARALGEAQRSVVRFMVCGMNASAHDFDFIFGSWDVANRKLVDVTDPTCTDWAAFDAVSTVAPILGGGGHTDRMMVSAPTDRGPPFEGFTLRIFNPTTSTWQIWWSSTRNPGTLEDPLEGRFSNGHGIFDAEETIAGRPVLTRFEWITDRPERPRWQQSFSYDNAQTWTLNWTMHFTRRAPAR